SCAAFENGISESYHSVIGFARTKPIITMREEIKVYLMQRLFAMNQNDVNLNDITYPSIRKEIEKTNQYQRRPKPQQDKRKPSRKSQQATNQPFNLPNTDPSIDPSVDPSADPSADLSVDSSADPALTEEREARRKDVERVLEEANKIGVYKKRGTGGFREPSKRIKNQKRKKEDSNGPGTNPNITLDVSD
ncbi:hypothetical protein Tco_1453566, partial [Tanacetum coccineum]